MSLVVCIDALIYWNGSVLANRNTTSVKQIVAVAEAKPFVANYASAYASKQPTWKDWTVTINGYYDNTDKTIQNAIANGTTGQVVIYPTRTDLTNYWYGNAFVTAPDHTMTSEAYSELNAELAGSGVLTWI
jgi:hypothetical protein